MKITREEIIASLKQRGYKLTPQRRAVIQTILSSQDHLTPAIIHRKLNQGNHHIGLVTIYRTLEILTELGLVCELHAGGICRSYTIGALQHHHHLICAECGMVVDFSGHDLSGLERSLSDDSGFRIDDHLLEFIGVCRECQEVS